MMENARRTVHAKDERPRVIVIGGPTASGKSGLAMGLAHRLDGCIVNADSLQLYRELPILTAAPDAAAMRECPHRLYGVLDPDRPSSAGSWAADAAAVIDETLAAGKMPIVVGGSGLYIEALIRGLAAVPPVDPSFRATAEVELAGLGHAAFHARLVAADPASAHLKPGDTHRILRAWEILVATGKPLAEWQAKRVAPPPYEFRLVALLPERDTLYEACNTRFLRMLDAGAIDEAAAFIARWPMSVPAAKALGLKQLSDYLSGNIPLDRAIALAQAETRHFAKRQTTWVRNRFVAKDGAMVPQPREREKMIDEIVAAFRQN
jgi:tRNA dimethylallyltransferase